MLPGVFFSLAHKLSSHLEMTGQCPHGQAYQRKSSVGALEGTAKKAPYGQAEGETSVKQNL